MDYNQELSNFKYKIKRLLIEFHHHKNKTSHNKSVVHDRDRTKPLMTLRTLNNGSDSLKSIAIDETFDGFSCIGEAAGMRPSGDCDATFSITRGVVDTMKYIIGDLRRQSSEVSLQKKRDECQCPCHSNPHQIIYNKHLDTCLQACSLIPSNNSENIGTLEEQLLKSGVHYIGESQQPKQPSRFHRFMNWLHGRHQASSNSHVDCSGKMASSSFDPEGRIEIITESHLPDAETSSPKERIKSPAQENRASSYARKRQNPVQSLIGLARDHTNDVRCSCSLCDKKQHKVGTQPWKVVMNDISLYAALLSTGSKPNTPTASFQPLVLDFTQSKHHYDREYDCQQIVMNDENVILDTDLLDLNEQPTTTLLPTRSKTLNASVKVTTKNNSTVLRSNQHSNRASTCTPQYTLDQTYGYPDVLLDYNYSDDDNDITYPLLPKSQLPKPANNSGSLEFLPLSIIHK